MIESCKNTRTLLVISNFVNLKRVRIPDMITQLETAFNITVDNDKAVSNTTGRTYPSPPPSPFHTRSPIGSSLLTITILTPQALMSVVGQLDQKLFEKFIKPKVPVATGKLRGGILDPKMDCYETPQPTGERNPSAPRRAAGGFFLTAGFTCFTAEIRPYMFETLLYLVGVHAQVNEVAPPLLDRMLNALVESLVEEALRCFRQVKRFGMGGMLRVGHFIFNYHHIVPFA